MVAVLVLSIALVLLAVFLFSLRLLFVRGGEFRGTCAGNNPMLQQSGGACGVCGRQPGEACAQPKADTTALPAASR